METTQEILNKLRDYKATFAEKYGIERLGLFGSCARGEQDDRSDIDVIIKMRQPSYFVCFDIRDIFYILVIINTTFPNNFPLFSHFLHKKCLHLKNIV